MRIETRQAVLPLTAQTIDHVAEQVEGFLYELNMERTNVLRIRLSLEEALLRWQEHFGEEAEVRFTAGRRLFRPFIALELAGESCDPLAADDEGLSVWSQDLLAGIGLIPNYSYQRGVNLLQIRLRRPRIDPALALLAAVAIGLLIGFLGLLFFPDDLRLTMLRTVLDPIQNAFFRILNAAAGPMLFFTVLVAVCGMGSLVGRDGKRMVLRFLVVSVLMTVTALIVSHLAFSLRYEPAHLSDNEFSGMLDFFLQLFPHDLLSPFINGDSPQLILIALILGNALLILGAQAGGLVKLAEQANVVVLLIADWVGRLCPFFIAILLILGIWNGTLEGMQDIWMPLLLALLLILAALAGCLLWVSLRKKVPFSLLTAKVRESFVVAFRAASVDTAFGLNQACCEKRLGISPKFTSYSLPLGLVLYMPASTMATMVFTMYAAMHFGITTSAPWCVMALFVTVALMVASPPLGGVGLLAYAAIFSRLGIPAEGLTIALVAELLFSFICAAANQLMLQMELVLQADRMDMLDRERLRKDMPRKR